VFAQSPVLQYVSEHLEVFGLDKRAAAADEASSCNAIKVENQLRPKFPKESRDHNPHLVGPVQNRTHPKIIGRLPLGARQRGAACEDAVRQWVGPNAEGGNWRVYLRHRYRVFTSE